MNKINGSKAGSKNKYGLHFLNIGELVNDPLNEGKGTVKTLLIKSSPLRGAPLTCPYRPISFPKACFRGTPKSPDSHDQLV